MLKLVRQARTAISMLNPDEVRSRANRAVSVGLVATSGAGYARMEDFLVPAVVPHRERLHVRKRLHRAGDPNVPETVDFVFYEAGLPAPRGTYVLHTDDRSGEAMAEILHGNEDLALPLARQFPAFRRPVVDRIIQAVARENALFALATALPNVVPNLIELPWALGEFASDTVFLTANQVRLAFLVAAACGQDVGFKHQKADIASIVAGAFGWRALARELVSHVPLGGGLIPKGAIAYAGTFVVGKGLEYFHHTRVPFNPEQRRLAYQEGLERGKAVAESIQSQG
jgi:uncharacterized protein (DUF697 family)